MELIVIAAVADNGVIGRGNSLPWHLPEDLAHFRTVTMGHPVVMGRRTHEAIGRPLDGRLNIVLSRDPDYRPRPGCRLAGCPRRWPCVRERPKSSSSAGQNCSAPDWRWPIPSSSPASTPRWTATCFSLAATRPFSS